MKKARLLLTTVVTALTLQVSADNIYDKMDFQKIEVPEMKAELVELEAIPVQARSLSMNSVSSVNNASSRTEVSKKWEPDFHFFKSRTNPGTKPYKFMDDMTFVGIPLFAAGWALKSDKAMFRVNNKEGKKNTQLLTDFKTGIDDYTQFFGPAMVVGLKLGGLEGRSDWPRLLASAGMSYGLMAALVNGIKYSAKEMRPDGSTANSWPSGHTATAFVGATLLHKEYGLTRSPWFSVAGYGVATATGVMRVLNNRHWISDVMSGAGIGIMATELGYALSDVLFKGKGLLRNDLEMDFENPSFFSINMGVGIGGKDIDFSLNDMVGAEGFFEGYDVGDIKENIKFRASTVVDAEGAYFFNKYIGVGGRFRVRAMSAKSFGDFTNYLVQEDYNAWSDVAKLYAALDEVPCDDAYLKNFFNNTGLTYKYDEAFYNNAPITNLYGIVKSDHMTEFTGSVGLYFNIPLSKRFALGFKALIGRSITQELDIDGHAEGNVKDIDYSISYTNGQITKNWLEIPKSTGEKYTYEWDYLTLGANNSTSYGSGISLTYKYKSNFSWRIFCDYDYTEKTYTMTVNPYKFLDSTFTPNAYSFLSIDETLYTYMNSIEYKKDKKMNYFTLGLSFLVNL